VTQRRHLAKKDAKNEALRAVKNFKRTG